MIVKIDTRERDLIKKCQDLLVAVPAFKDLKIEVCTLPLGDIIITTNQGDNQIDNVLSVKHRKKYGGDKKSTHCTTNS